MEKLKAKLKKQAGFTMVELLIVVAIIGILAAVSIPMFNNALEKARHGVDAANARSAISLANAEAIASIDPEKEFPTTDGPIFYYIVDGDDHQGALMRVDKGDTAPTEADGAVVPQCTTDDGDTVLQVKIIYDPDNIKDKPLEAFDIQTNWKIDPATGHVTSGTTFATGTKGSTTSP